MNGGMRDLVPNAPEVKTTVKTTPAKRNTTLEVPLSKAPLATKGYHRGIAKVNRTEVHLTLEPYNGVYFPKTLAACDALLVLLAAVRDELVEQGVES